MRLATTRAPNFAAFEKGAIANKKKRKEKEEERKEKEE